MESSSTIARQAAWNDSIKKNALQVLFTTSSILICTSAVEPYILTPKPTFSQVYRYVRSALIAPSLLDYKLRVETWQSHQFDVVDLRQLRLLKALSRIRQGSIAIVLGTWILHGVNVYYSKFHEAQQQVAMGRVALPVEQSVIQDQVVSVRLTPTLPTETNELSRRPVYVRTSPLSVPSAASIFHLDYSIASKLLSQSIAKYFSDQHLRRLPWLQYSYERIHATLTAQPQYCIPHGKIFVQSYDSQISSPKELIRSFLTGLYSPLAQEVLGESDLNRAIGFSMDLLACTYPLMVPTHQERSQHMQLFHLHIHWRNPSLSEYTRDYNTCAVVPSLKDVFRAFMLMGDELDATQATHRLISSGKKSETLLDWQEKIFQLFLHSYESQLVSHSPREGVSSEYFLFQLDARPFLLYRVTQQLLLSYSMWRSQYLKGPVESTLGRTAVGNDVLNDKEGANGDDRVRSTFLFDKTLSAVESIGRQVRSNLSFLTQGLASAFSWSINSDVKDKKTLISIYVDQESTAAAPVLFTAGKQDHVKTMANLGDYICQGLSHIDMKVSTQWNGKDLLECIEKEQMPVVLTLGHSLPWLYYRIQVLSQRYPNIPIYAVHVHDHQTVGYRDDSSSSVKGHDHGSLPAHVHMVSTQGLQEEIWSIFQLQLFNYVNDEA